MAALVERKKRLRVTIAHRLARRLVARRQALQQRSDGAVSNAGATASWDAYEAWRYDVLCDQFTRHFGPESAKGKCVLDFGCGDGALCMILMDAGAEIVHGTDIDERSLRQFAARLARRTGKLPTFSRSPNPALIDQPTQRYDAVFCMDTVEHIINYRSIIHEWHRVLRPGGSVYIAWQPYWHPYGHHAYDWVPIPWAHVFLRDDELNEVCARIVEWPAFDAPVWDRDADGGKVNRFRVPSNEEFLNKLTVREFESLCKAAGFALHRREFQPFNYPQPLKAISALLTKVPVARDFFMAYAVYELVRPTSRQTL